MSARGLNLVYQTPTITCRCWLLQVASLEAALSEAEARLARQGSTAEVRAVRAEQACWQLRSDLQAVQQVAADRQSEIQRMQLHQRVSKYQAIRW